MALTYLFDCGSQASVLSSLSFFLACVTPLLKLSLYLLSCSQAVINYFCCHWGLPKVIPLPFFLFLNHCFNWSHDPCGWKHFKHYKSKIQKQKNSNTTLKSISLSHQMLVHSEKGIILYPSRYVPYLYEHIYEYISLWFFYTSRSTLFTQLFFSLNVLWQSS